MRVFVAAELPDEMYDALCETSALLRASVRGRYVAPDSFHVTLAFLGNVESWRIDDAVAQPAEVELLAGNDPVALPVVAEGMPYGHAVVGLRIHEGKKHQVKRMLRAVGHEVVRLHRDEFGPIVLGDVAMGCWRELTATERAAIEELAARRY